MNVLTPDLSERKRILKDICQNHPQWKVRAALTIVLSVLTIGVLMGTVYLIAMHPTPDVIMAFGGSGIIFAFIPYAIAQSVKNTAKYKCGFPYSSYVNGSLLLTEDGLEYVFWRAGPREPAAYSSKRAVYRDEDKFVYRIGKNDISSITIEDDICRIKGNGTIHIPDWTGEIDEFVKRKNTEFSFIMAFEQKNAKDIIEEWRK